MGIQNDVEGLMTFVEEYGEAREWHGARPGDDLYGQLGKAEQAVRDALIGRLALEYGTLVPALHQLESGDVEGAKKMLARRINALSDGA